LPIFDHGKSTLADRLLEYTGTVVGKKMQEQVLDDMEWKESVVLQLKAMHKMEYSNKGQNLS
jgi:GTP-binding protein LepA